MANNFRKFTLNSQNLC